jgi:ABC-type Fe3+-hydroxamate transport system substrate-binding protein
MQSLLDISYINVGKMPAKDYTTSKYQTVKDEYKIWAPILIWQLIKYNPDVIIF